MLHGMLHTIIHIIMCCMYVAAFHHSIIHIKLQTVVASRDLSDLVTGRQSLPL